MTNSPEREFDEIVERYYETISEVRERFDSISAYGHITPSTPIYLQYRAEYLCSYNEFGNESNEAKEVEDIKLNTKELVNSSDSEFIHSVVAELMELVEQYPIRVASAFELDPISNEVEQTLYTRDNIEMILTFLSDLDESFLQGLNKDVQECKIRIKALDTAFERRFELHDDLLRKYRDQFRREYYPDQYWWRHPELVLRNS